MPALAGRRLAHARRRATLAELADQPIFGWKDLLTTLPPVDGDGPLLVLPWLLGLAAGVPGAALSQLIRPARVGRRAAPGPGRDRLLAVASSCSACGTRRRCWLQGAVFAALALGLAGAALAPGRGRRSTGGTAGWVRVASGPARCCSALAAAGAAGRRLVAATTATRAVLRDYVEPPFDVGHYPSPLSAFRRYVDLPGPQRPRQPLRQDAVHGRRAPRPGTRSASPRSTTTTAWSGVPPTTPSRARPTTPSSGSPRRSTTPPTGRPSRSA